MILSSFFTLSYRYCSMNSLFGSHLPVVHGSILKLLNNRLYVCPLLCLEVLISDKGLCWRQVVDVILRFCYVYTASKSENVWGEKQQAGLDFMAVFDKISGVHNLLARVQEWISDKCAHLIQYFKF